MSQVPVWVSTSVGIYAILGSVFMLLLIYVAIIMLRAIVGLQKEVQRLGDRVDGIAVRVDQIAKEVQHVTREASIRTTGILRLVDDAAGGAVGALQKHGPWFLGIAAVLRMYGAMRKLMR